MPDQGSVWPSEVRISGPVYRLELLQVTSVVYLTRTHWRQNLLRRVGRSQEVSRQTLALGSSVTKDQAAQGSYHGRGFPHQWKRGS